MSGETFVVARIGTISPSRRSRDAAPISYAACAAETPASAAARRPPGDVCGSSRVADDLEPALGLRDEELRDGDVVLAETAKSHLVELDETP